MGFFDKLKKGLGKTKNSIDEKINNVFSVFRKVDEELLEELEEVLIMSDIGVDTSVKIIDEEITVVYECDCSREKTIEALIAIGEKDLKAIIEEDGKASIVCHYCNKIYDFTKEDLEKIIKEL